MASNGYGTEHLTAVVIPLTGSQDLQEGLSSTALTLTPWQVTRAIRANALPFHTLEFKGQRGELGYAGAEKGDYNTGSSPTESSMQRQPDI